MPLSKIYTRAKVRSSVRELAKEVSEDKVQNPAIDEIINLNTLDLCEMLNGATQPDYGATSVLGDAATHYSTSIVVSGVTYTDATKTITKTGHGFTNADIGRRIILYDTDASARCGISRIAGITSTSAFTIEHSMGGTFSICTYAVLSRQSSTSLDLSSLKIDKLIKLVDSTNGLIPLKNAFEIENIANLIHNSTEAFAYHEGETIYLVKGSDVANWGTLTLHYYRLPTLPSADTDYIDLKDKYMRLLIDKCVIDVFALAKLEAPSQVVAGVEARTQAIRQLNTEKEASLRTKQRG